MTIIFTATLDDEGCFHAQASYGYTVTDTVVESLPDLIEFATRQVRQAFDPPDQPSAYNQ